MSEIKLNLPQAFLKGEVSKTPNIKAADFIVKPKRVTRGNCIVNVDDKKKK